VGPFLHYFAWGETGWGDELFFGAVVTVQIAFASYAFGLALGLIGAGARLSHSRLVSLPAFAFSIIFRGLPELLIISLIYFGGSLAIRALLAPFGIQRYVEFNPFLSGVLALGLVIGAYITELFRGAILAVSPGQGDAARALGLGWLQSFFLIILPQAFRIALPGLANLWMTNLKNTALLSVIGLTDMVRVAYLGAASTRSPLPFFTAVAIGYLILTYISQLGLVRLEVYANRGTAEPVPKAGQG
jgi:His/Glu/Gln/Arg/opine family amino acid ABC transporter permease subunit